MREKMYREEINKQLHAYRGEITKAKAMCLRKHMFSTLQIQGYR